MQTSTVFVRYFCRQDSGLPPQVFGLKVRRLIDWCGGMPPPMICRQAIRHAAGFVAERQCKKVLAVFEVRQIFPDKSPQLIEL